MSVIYMRPRAGRQADFGKITEWSATREWLAKTNNRFDEENVILGYGYSQGILPVPFVNVLGTNPLLLCRKVMPKQEKNSPQHWVITAEYSSEWLSKQEKDEQQYPNPVDRPAKISWASTKYNKPCIFDSSNNLILNSAGDPFDPPAEFDQSRWTFKVSKNVDSVPSWIIDYTDAVNNATFTVQGVSVNQYCAKIMSIEISDEQTAQIDANTEITYFVFSYSVEIRAETWKLQLLDQGFRQKGSDSTKREHIKDDATPAKFVSKPWPLDGAGKKLSNPTPSTAKILKFDVYNYKPFNILPGLS